MVANVFECIHLVGELPGFRLVEPHERCVNDKRVIHGQIQRNVERFDEAVPAIGITAEIRFAYARDQMFCADALGQYSSKAEEQQVSSLHKRSRQTVAFGNFDIAAR